MEFIVGLIIGLIVGIIWSFWAINRQLENDKE